VLVFDQSSSGLWVAMRYVETSFDRQPASATQPCSTAQVLTRRSVPLLSYSPPLCEVTAS
jgi:hypothetical protein